MVATLEAESRRLGDQVDRLEAEHPPLELAAVDFTVVRPDVVINRFGRVLDWPRAAERG